MNNHQETLENKIYHLLSLDTSEAKNHELITAVLLGYEILACFEADGKQSIYSKIIESKLDAVNDELSLRDIYLKTIVLTDERILLIPCSIDEFDMDDERIFWRYMHRLENAPLTELINFVQKEAPEAHEFISDLKEILHSRN